MLPYFTEVFGNAASRTHKQGQHAATAVEHAREQCALAIDTRPADIIWLSGATEANNLAIKGIAAQYEARHHRPGHIVTQATEHKAVLDPVQSLQKKGWRVTVLPVDDSGRIASDDVAVAIADDTALVSIMWVNNELGVIMPIEDIGAICQERGVPFHSDASQAVGKIPISLTATRIDLLSISAHKFYGPKGIGALAIRRSSKNVRPLALQEGGVTSGASAAEHLTSPASWGWVWLATWPLKPSRRKSPALVDYVISLNRWYDSKYPM